LDLKGRKKEILPKTDDGSEFHHPESAVLWFMPCCLQSNHAFALLDCQILP
jgi:hypothetical protein